MSGRTANSNSSDASSPFASLTSVSIAVVGRTVRMASTHAATWAKPLSARSSRATIVSTACDRPLAAMAAATRAGSSAAGDSGLRVSTRQKPHARVQRSPSTMKVAVPAAQHSLRFGQPASSHTVTRPCSRTVRFIASTSEPSCIFGRSHSGLRVEIVRPSATPADSSRASARPMAPGPSPRERRQIRGDLLPRHILALHRAVAPQRRRPAGDDVGDDLHRRVNAFLGERGDRLVGDAAGHDVLP